MTVILPDLDISVPGIAALLREDQPDSPGARLWSAGECFFCFRMGRVRYVGHYRIPGFSIPMGICTLCLRDREDMVLAYSQSAGSTLLNYPEWPRVPHP